MKGGLCPVPHKAADQKVKTKNSDLPAQIFKTNPSRETKHSVTTLEMFKSQKVSSQNQTDHRYLDLKSFQVLANKPGSNGKVKLPSKHERRKSKNSKSSWISPRFPPTQSSWVNAHKQVRSSF